MYIDICCFLQIVILISYVFANHWLKKILRFSNSSKLLSFIYRSQWIVLHGTKELECSVFLKPLLKSKSYIRKFSAYFTIIFILDIILFNFNSVFSFFSCIAIKKSIPYLRLLKNCLKW